MFLEFYLYSLNLIDYNLKLLNTVLQFTFL